MTWTQVGRTSTVIAADFSPLETSYALSTGRGLLDGNQRASAEVSVTVWDLSSGQPSYTLPAARGLLAMAFSSDGKQMATIDGDAVLRVEILPIDALVA